MRGGRWIQIFVRINWENSTKKIRIVDVFIAVANELVPFKPHAAFCLLMEDIVFQVKEVQR